jgi:hypothetical protein
MTIQALLSRGAEGEEEEEEDRCEQKAFHFLVHSAV